MLGSAARMLPALVLTTWPWPLDYNSHNLIKKQRDVNSKMTRAELKSGFFATGNVANLEHESTRAIPCCSYHGPA